MAKNINKSYPMGVADLSVPISNRSPHGSNELFLNTYIKTLINGAFLKLGILTSEISISRNCVGNNTIQFLYYPLISRNNKKKLDNKILLAIKAIKLILALKEPASDFKFICVKAHNKFTDAKLLNDYVNIRVLKDPNRIKYIASSVLREYKLQRKNDTIINKSKNHR